MIGLHHYPIADSVVAFSTTRHGGVSEGNYAAFNINHYCGDLPAAIVENRRRLCAQLGVDERRLIYPHQTHQAEVRRIDAAFLNLDDAARQPLLEGIDAVMTDERGVCIGVSTADCIPILLYDEAHHAIAAVHAGWRGTVARIAEKTVAAMQQAYHSDPSQLRAVIGPGISLKNFEVGDEVYEAFRDAAFPMERIAQRYAKGTASRWHIDLPLCNQLQLEAAGLQPLNISQSGICTYDHVSDFFSARRLGIHSGRILTAIMLRP